jgi:hypothetical protein
MMREAHILQLQKIENSLFLELRFTSLNLFYYFVKMRLL